MILQDCKGQRLRRGFRVRFEGFEWEIAEILGNPVSSPTFVLRADVEVRQVTPPMVWVGPNTYRSHAFELLEPPKR